MRHSSHIAIFVPSLRGGGAERVMVTLANSFAERGHRVDLVLVRAEGPYLPDVSEKVRIVDLDRPRVLAALIPLARYLRRERPDAMLSAMTHANIVAILAHKLARFKGRLAVSERNTPSRGLIGGGSKRLQRMLVRALYPSADAIICVSRAMQDEMAQMFGLPAEKLHTIYNPVDLDRVHRMMEEPVTHEWLSRKDVPVILAVGRLTEQKDYPTLLSAFALLRERQPARLIILGEGELEAELKQRAIELGIADDVDFPGFQANPYSWMRAADLYVMSSRWEGLPNSLIEALACGARIVSTDCPTGPAEILEDGRWGGLVRVANPEELTMAIDVALDSAPHASGRGLTRFDAEHVRNQYLALLSGAVSG